MDSRAIFSDFRKFGNKKFYLIERNRKYAIWTVDLITIQKLGSRPDGDPRTDLVGSPPSGNVQASHRYGYLRLDGVRRNPVTDFQSGHGRRRIEESKF